jgi:hypothetical protein
VITVAAAEFSLGRSREGSVMDSVARYFAVLGITSLFVLIAVTTFWLTS